MELRPITDLEQWYARELTEAFPPNERKPLADIRALLEAGRYEALGLYDGAALLGYANLWREPAVSGYVLLDYLAVCRDKPRGHGYGTAALRLLLDRCRDRRGLLVEVEAEEPGAEAEENALRRRRLAFYRRGGFRDLGYTARIFGVPYAMLVSGQSDQAEAAEAHRRLYHYEFSPWLYRRFIHIPEED